MPLNALYVGAVKVNKISQFRSATFKLGQSTSRPRANVTVQVNLSREQPVLPGMWFTGLVNISVLDPIPDVTELTISIRKHERSMTIFVGITS